MSTTWKAAIGVILVFILGWFGGALSTLIVVHHRILVMARHDPEPLAKLLERQTTRNLGLTDDQKKQLHAIFVSNLSQRMELQKQIQPQVKVVNSQTLQQIDAMLTPDQQQTFHDNLLKFKRRFGRNPFNMKEEDQPAASTTVPASPATNSGAASPP
jgi:hypothetical protein